MFNVISCAAEAERKSGLKLQLDAPAALLSVNSALTALNVCICQLKLTLKPQLETFTHERHKKLGVARKTKKGHMT